MKIFINLLLGAFLLVSVGVLIAGTRTLMVAIESNDWPATTGTIVRSRLDVKAGTQTTPRRARVWKVEYRTTVAFRYQVGEQAFSSDTVTVEFDKLPTDDRQEAETLLRKYPVGREVPVYYRPSDPTVGVLEPGVSFRNVAGVLIGLSLICVTSLIMFAYNKYKSITQGR